MSTRRVANAMLFYACLLFVITVTTSSSTLQRTQLKSRHEDSRNLKTGNGDVSAGCVIMYEWSDCEEEIDGYQYTGQNTEDSGVIRSFNTPLFDNVDLEGSPVSRLRGSYILNPTNQFATFTSAFDFIEQEDSLVFHMGFSSKNQTEQYGVPLGGTGRWTGYQGNVTGKPMTDVDSSPAIVRYSVCPSSLESA